MDVLRNLSDTYHVYASDGAKTAIVNLLYSRALRLKERMLRIELSILTKFATI